MKRRFFIGGFSSLFVAIAILFGLGSTARAQVTAFTYQGRLNLNAAAATGTYDFQFKLHPLPNAVIQVGGTVTNLGVAVSNGLFVTAIDFGAVFNYSPLYLEIGIRTNGDTNFTILSPTQQITSAPYAVQALYATSYTGAIQDSQLAADVVRFTTNVVFTNKATFSNAIGGFSGTFSGAASGTFSGSAGGTFSGAATGTFTGDGSNLTNVNATNLLGIVKNNPNWQLLQSSGQQAVSGNNYITTNNANLALTLPTSPGVGDTIQISGGGSGGWTLNQTGSQAILTAPFGSQAGQYFKTNTLYGYWHAVCSSGSGGYLCAGAYSGYIYYSHDAGVTWTQSDAPYSAWSSLASSTDGNHVIASIYNGHIYQSTNAGVNWTLLAGSPSATFTNICCSSDGSKLAACTTGSGVVYTSYDAGVTWSNRLSGQNYSGIASSSDGTRLAVCTSGNYVYTSTDSGMTWTSRGSSTYYYSGIASSSDGNHLAATVKTGYIYVSTDGGATWSARASSQPWVCVTSSADGENLAAAYSSGYIQTSTDGGLTWTNRATSFGVLPWTGIACSTTGSRIIACDSGGYLFVSTASTTIGTTGYLTGLQYSSVNLQYIGNNYWMPLSFTGQISGY